MTQIQIHNWLQMTKIDKNPPNEQTVVGIASKF